MTPHKEWVSLGKLYPCKNPQHHFSFRNLLGYWQWAEDCWSSVNTAGNLQNYFFHIGTIEALGGVKGYKFVFWKFILVFGFW